MVVSRSDYGAVEGSWCSDCDFGCCGTYGAEYCCDAPLGPIIGGTVGGVAFLGTLIGVICFCVKKHGHRAPLVHPFLAHNAAMALSGPSGHYPPYPAATYPMWAQAPGCCNVCGQAPLHGCLHSNPFHLPRYATLAPESAFHDGLPASLVPRIKVAIAVGGVLGGLVLLAGLLTLFCMCTKTQTKGGRVVAPAAYGGPSVAYSGSSGQYPMQPMGPQPPPYTAATAPPPSYSYTTPSATWAGAGMPSVSAPSSVSSTCCTCTDPA